VERAHLHEAVGNTLEALYEGRIEPMAASAAIALAAPQLARHFQEAGIAEKAMDYLRQAGDRAMRLSANAEAIAHFTQGLALLKTLPDTAQRAQRELGLQTGLILALVYIKGFADPEVDSVLARAWELCQQMGEAPQLFQVMVAQRVIRGEHQAARETLEQIFGLPELAEEPLLVVMAHRLMGWLLVCLGEFAPALDHAERVMDLYAPQQRHAVAAIYGVDPGVHCLSWASWALWFLGYPEQALNRSRKALAMARELDHPYSLADAQSTGGAMVHLFRRDHQAARALAEASLILASEHEFRYFVAQATMQRGRALAEQGGIEEGIAQLRQGLATWETTGTRYRRPTFLAWLAEAYGKAGQVEEGLSVLAEALAQVEKTDERYYEAELHRLKGELLLMQGDETEAEASLPRAESCFQRAIEVARRQSAKSWELRATVSLARLWQKQGWTDEARRMLAEIYGWFTEGFDTPDLKEAKALRAQLEQR
jgi:predicted ATPase